MSIKDRIDQLNQEVIGEPNCSLINVEHLFSELVERWGDEIPEDFEIPDLLEALDEMGITVHQNNNGVFYYDNF